MGDAQFQKLKANLNRTHRYPPLIVHPIEDGYEIIDGAQRFRAAQELGWETVRCEIWTEISETEVKLYLATLNRLRGTDDTQKRAKIIAELQEDLGDDSLLRTLIPESDKALDSMLALALKDTPDYRDEQGLIEEKLMNAGVDIDTAKDMANLYQPPSGKLSLKFVFTDGVAYNKAAQFFGRPPNVDKLIELVEQYGKHSS